MDRSQGFKERLVFVVPAPTNHELDAGGRLADQRHRRREVSRQSTSVDAQGAPGSRADGLDGAFIVRR
jgi:hypothetical protein